MLVSTWHLLVHIPCLWYIFHRTAIDVFVSDGAICGFDAVGLFWMLDSHGRL